MDRLLDRQAAIQRALAERHLQGGQLVLYDLTSSYFEGEYVESDLVTFGHNRDGKKGHEQLVIGLLCNAQGCPVGIEVFRGNTKDSTTTLEQVRRLQKDYGLTQLIWVGDRGAITQANAAQIQSASDLHSISALTHPEIVKLLERKVLQAELFDEKKIVEVLDPPIQPSGIACAAIRIPPNAKPRPVGGCWTAPATDWRKLSSHRDGRKTKSSVPGLANFWLVTRWGNLCAGRWSKGNFSGLSMKRLSRRSRFSTAAM